MDRSTFVEFINHIEHIYGASLSQDDSEHIYQYENIYPSKINKYVYDKSYIKLTDYVSANGTDSSICGNITDPCMFFFLHIYFAITDFVTIIATKKKGGTLYHASMLINS